MLDDISTTMRTIWDHQLIQLDGAWVTPGKLFIGLMVFGFGLWLARQLSRRAANRLMKGLHVASGTAVVFQTLLHYCLVLIVLLIALQAAGLPLTAFTIFGGALAIGIGFGSQNILNNFISGLIMLIERPIKPGDLVQIGEQIGIVKHIGARATLLIDYKGIAHLIPNSHFLEHPVTNWHYSDDLVCASISIGVAYGSDTNVVRRLLLETATGSDLVVSEPSPRVLFNDFGNDALIFEVLMWTHARRVIERREVESNLRFDIDRVFRDNGIVIAFPQRDVHLDASTPIPVRVVPATTQTH